MATIQTWIGNHLYVITHTRRAGMWIGYGSFGCFVIDDQGNPIWTDPWPSRSEMMVPGLPVGAGDGWWEDF